MPYLKLVKRPHECNKPTSIFGHKGSRGVYVGTVWACPQCGQQWMIEIDDSENPRLLHWRKMDLQEYLPSDRPEPTPDPATVYGKK